MDPALHIENDICWDDSSCSPLLTIEGVVRTVDGGTQSIDYDDDDLCTVTSVDDIDINFEVADFDNCWTEVVVTPEMTCCEALKNDDKDVDAKDTVDAATWNEAAKDEIA